MATGSGSTPALVRVSLCHRTGPAPHQFGAVRFSDIRAASGRSICPFSEGRPPMCNVHVRMRSDQELVARKGQLRPKRRFRGWPSRPKAAVRARTASMAGSRRLRSLQSSTRALLRRDDAVFREPLRNLSIALHRRPDVGPTLVLIATPKMNYSSPKKSRSKLGIL